MQKMPQTHKDTQGSFLAALAELLRGVGPRWARYTTIAA